MQLRARPDRRRPRRHRHLGALPAARRRRRPPARPRRAAPAVYTEEAADELEAPERSLDGRMPSRCLRPRGRMPRGGEPSVTGDQAGLLVARRHARRRHRRGVGPLAAGATREELRERATGERATAALGAHRRPPQRAPSSARRPAGACSCTSTAPRCRCTPCRRPLIALAARAGGLPRRRRFIVGHLRQHRRRRARGRRALDVAGAQARAAPRRLHGPAARARADPLQRRLGRPVDGVGLRRSRCRSSTTRPAPSCRSPWRRSASASPSSARWRTSASACPRASCRCSSRRWPSSSAPAATSCARCRTWRRRSRRAARPSARSRR